GTSLGATATLRECMEYGDSHGEVRVQDDESRHHRLGSELYAVSYLATLAHLVRAGELEPVFQNEEQRLAWEAWTSGASGADTVAQPITDIPLRACATPKTAEAPEESPDFPVGRAGELLLEVLASEGEVRFERFYDDTVETEDRLEA